MALVKYSNDFKAGGYTVIDNVFIHQYLCDIPDKFLKVYLYGLYLLNNSDSNLNNVESLINALKITEQDALSAFSYFEENGMVSVLAKNPMLIEYLPLQGALAKPKKFKPSKYADFSKQVQALLPERNISTAEFSEYYNLIETYQLQPEALITIISYCAMLKGKTISYRYILTVAKNWVARGITTLEACEKELANYNRQANDISDILIALGLRGYADYQDSELYTKWTVEWGFIKDAIIFAAKYLKKQKGNMQKLDDLLSQFYSNKKMSEKEMVQYLIDIKETTQTAKTVLKALGLIIYNISPVIDSYISPWLDLGYSSETLTSLSNYCFKCGIKTLEGINHLIKRLFKKGLISLPQINGYIEQKYKDDKFIRKILEAAGIMRDLSNFDRDNYEIWSNVWKVSDELILFAAKKCSEELNAIKSMHILLNAYKNSKVSTVEQAEKVKLEKYAPKKDGFNNYPERDYSKEELNSLMIDINEIEEL